MFVDTDTIDLHTHRHIREDTIGPDTNEHVVEPQTTKAFIKDKLYEQTVHIG